MDRRSFLTLGTTIAIVPSLLSGCQSANGSVNKSAAAGGVYFTKENPGRWNSQGKINGHLPRIEVAQATKEVIVNTKHSMKDYNHYIVKHVILDKNFSYIDESIFKPGADAKAFSKYPLTNGKLKGYSGTLYALSMCNLHDVWLNEIKI